MFPDNIFITDLNKAVSESEKLMQTEYYSMRLICDVGGFDKTTLDAEIINVSISKEDNSLANDEKIVKAQNLVSNRNYEESKNTIIYNLDICLDGIVSYTENRQNYYITVFKDVFIKLEITSAIGLTKSNAVTFIKFKNQYVAVKKTNIINVI